MLARALLCFGIVLWCSSVAHAQVASRAALGPIERGIGLYDGRSVAFEVIAGWAVVEGDIIIGRADELTWAVNDPASDLRPKTFAIGYQANLWPKAP